MTGRHPESCDGTTLPPSEGPGEAGGLASGGNSHSEQRHSQERTEPGKFFFSKVTQGKATLWKETFSLDFSV